MGVMIKMMDKGRKLKRHLVAAAKLFITALVFAAAFLFSITGAFAETSGNIIWDPSISTNPTADEGPGEVMDGEAADNTETDPAAQSLLTPDTVFATSDPSIVYINGRSIDLNRPVAALTYDDGPATDNGNRIMDVMAEYGQKCTFFLVGVRIAKRAEEVQRMVHEGHQVANHTYSHEYFTKISTEAAVNQITACTDLIETYAGVTPTLMRLPGGLYTDAVLQNITMPIILWSIDTRDWETKSASKTISSVLDNIKSGDIVLMHETYSATADATETIVPELTAAGYQLLTVSELAAVKGVELEPGTIYRKFY